jgi:carnitine O-acetyltransferase
LPIGALTSDNRDLWTDARTALIAASPSHNATVLRQIESAMIIVVLDEAKPVTREDISWNTWTGNAGNRWFDKHQRAFRFSDASCFVLIIGCLVVVYDNGRSGFLGEHSCMDGTPTLRMNEYILATIALGRADLGPERNAETGKDLARPEELVFEVNGKVEELVKGAAQRYDELLAQHDMQVRCSQTLVYRRE